MTSAKRSSAQNPRSGCRMTDPATKPEQPEYIIDEYTLGEIERLLNLPEHAWDDSDYDAKETALKIIRSRPASAPTDERSCLQRRSACEECEVLCCPDFGEQHNAAIRNATRQETIYEILKHFRFSCPGGEVTSICDLCGANQYCNEIRQSKAEAHP